MWVLGIVLVFLTLFGLVGLLWYKADQANRRECTEGGGRVVEIKGSSRGGWFCEESK